MKKKILSIIVIVISFLLMYGSITIGENTIESAQDRVVALKFAEPAPIEEMPDMENPEAAEETIEEEKTNSYNKKELAIIITSSVVFTASFILVIYATMVLFGGIKRINSFRVAFTYALLVITLSEIIIITTIKKTDNTYLNGKSYEVKVLKKEQALHVINKETEELDKIYESIKQNESVLKITDEATYNGTNINITKTSGKNTQDEEVNNVLLATNSSKVTLKDSNIISNNKESSAIYATKMNTIVDLDNVNITTTKDDSKGIVTKENSELTIQNSTITTTGNKSELFYSGSTITSENINAITNSNIATIFQANNLTINNSILETNLLEEQKGLFIITSTEEEYSEYTNAQIFLERNTIKANNNSPYFNTTPLFYVENTNSKINITKNNITYGKETLLKVVTNNKFNPKTTTLTMTDTIIRGNILVDSNSEAKINLNNVIYTGSINSNDESQSVDVVLDRTSIWSLTNHSYINKIQVQKNTNVADYIYSNGYNIYYNAQNNEELHSRVIYLPGGGRLIPVNKAS